MIDIYNEVGYIKNVIKGGLSSKWQRDATLMIRFFKMEGMKKPEAKKRIKDYCYRANRDQIIYFNDKVTYDIFNKIFESAWKKDIKLREIQYIDIPREVVQWFLELSENFTIDEDTIVKEKTRRPMCKFSGNKPINWERTKYLFTLYMWTKIQEEYLDRPNVHYLQKYSKRFKEDGFLKSSFSLQNERNFLFDLGLIDVNYALGIITKFMDDYEVFNTEVNDDNRVRIYTGEPGEGDLYNVGYWLEKQKNGFFVCEKCGKEVALKKNKKGGRPRKYCDGCTAKEQLKVDPRDENKVIKVCSRCGKEYSGVSRNDHNSKMCPKCYGEYRREYKTEKQREYRLENNENIQ